MQTRFSAGLFALALASLGVSAHAVDVHVLPQGDKIQATTVVVDEPATIRKNIPVVTRPSTPIELLQNIKIVMEHDLLSREDFYTDENLRQYFGWEKVRWGKNGPRLKYGSSPMGPNVVPRAGNPYKDFDFQYQRIDKNAKQSDDGKVRGSVGMATGHDIRLTAEVVQMVFGKDMVVSNPYANDNPRHPTLLMPKTHELGNLVIEYRFNNSIGRGFIGFVLNGDGTVNRFNLVDEER